MGAIPWPGTVARARGAALLLVSVSVMGTTLPLRAASPTEPAATPDTPVPARGLLRWNVAVEVPWIGAMGDLSVRHRTSFGYALGLAISKPIEPAIEVRVQLSQSHTYGGTGDITYVSGNSRASAVEVAAWRATMAALGATYVWRANSGIWAPYAGADFVAAYGGDAFTYTDPLAKSLEAPSIGPVTQLPTSHVGDGWLWGGGIRAGLRLELTDWLSTHSELGALALPVSAVPITNNRVIVDVRTAPHLATFIYGAFYLRILL